MGEWGEDGEDGEDVWRRRKCADIEALVIKPRGKNRWKESGASTTEQCQGIDPKGTYFYAKAAGDVHRSSHVEKFPFPPTGTAESPESIRFSPTWGTGGNGCVAVYWRRRAGKTKKSLLINNKR